MESYTPKNFDEPQTVKGVHKCKKDGWTIRGSSGWSFWLKGKHNITPKVGDTYQVRTQGVSYIVGIKWGDKVLFNHSDQELERKHAKEREEALIKKEVEFKENKAKLDTQYESLPDVFKRRIDKFRGNNPDFRRDYESYEMFCCTQAIDLANHFKTPKAVQEFAKIEKWEDQLKAFPGLSEDHSGNTFSISIKLAYLYLVEPEKIIMMYGALAPLVGSEEYGCIPRGKKNEEHQKKTNNRSGEIRSEAHQGKEPS